MTFEHNHSLLNFPSLVQYTAVLSAFMYKVHITKTCIIRCEITNYDESNNIRHTPNMTLTRKPTTKPICMRRLEGLRSYQSNRADYNLNSRKYNVRNWRVFASILPKVSSLSTPHKEEWKQWEEKSN
jgi:hypothetical protein